MKSKVLTLGFLLLAATILARAQAPAPQDQPPDQPLTPYETALLDYKTGKYQEGVDALDQGQAAQDEKGIVLKSRLLTELKQYQEAEKILRPLLTSTGPTEVQIALGDVLLRGRNFARAGKHYGVALQAQPNDPDLILKLVYSQVGANDFLDAEKNASLLKPLDPTHPCYYFAKAALAQATGKGQEADDDIQTVRTIYGISVTNRYLKTYLPLFVSHDRTSAPSDLTPAPLVNPAPSGVKQ